jgi:hypothetical protein
VLNWLCAAQERLAEQERILAGRPLPGSRKPAPEPRKPSGPSAWESFEERPAPAASAAISQPGPLPG